MMPYATPVHRYMGQRTAQQRRAEQDKNRRRQDAGRKARKQLYDSKAWEQLRQLARARDPFCVDCRPKLVPWTDLDHVVDMADGGESLSMDNVEGRCHSHHSAKTARTRPFGSR